MSWLKKWTGIRNTRALKWNEVMNARQAWTDANTFVNLGEESCCPLESSWSWFDDDDPASWLASFISLKGGVIAVWFLSTESWLAAPEGLGFFTIVGRSCCWVSCCRGSPSCCCECDGWPVGVVPARSPDLGFVCPGMLPMPAVACLALPVFVRLKALELGTDAEGRCSPSKT